ncbi:hypothetical protein HN51_024076 [Arachis hypogaea]|uniref:MD-2-related lipid-recognition domain-containing protein n=1 Tax=Arachis hypogaea TaxID=3818 RepID=A0A445C4H6_ARAHY|nr:putative phosphatidylglycerol/phosphatidylinositol transfer protein DDB_G0278295 [Arachis hypogaea]QHO27074.1 Putative phosphatidylglycerol/phosphatidylinositol transfer protein [Arachis hypogaea]RYR45855.1 hypothetical protein Ahy_A07g031627 [Arachis hypogaea]
MNIHSASAFTFLLCFLAIIFPLSSSNVQPQDLTFKYCDKNAKYSMKVSAVKASSNPVVRGVPFTINTTFHSDEAITGGKAQYRLKSDEVDAVYTYASNVCEEKQCPVSAGKHGLILDMRFPAVAPKGTYHMNMTFVDQNGKKLTCIISPFKVDDATTK